MLPLPLLSGTDAARCAYIILLMAVYWMFELSPLAAVALAPVAFFPLLGIMSTSAVTINYLKGTCMLVLASKY